MKVLIVRLKQIGDAVLALPVCNTLRKSAPEAEIHFMVYEHIAPLFEHHPSIDKLVRVTPLQRNNKAAFVKLLRMLRREKYDAVLDVINTPTSLLITRASGAPIQAGFASNKFRSRFYPTIIEKPGEGAGRRKVPVLEALEIPLLCDYSIDLHLLDSEVNQMNAEILKAGMDADRPRIAMMVTSRRDYKIWPADYFVVLANHLIGRYGAQLYFVYGPGEESAVRSLAGRVVHSENVFTEPAAPSTRDLACLLQCMDFFIGNDGGPRHIAQAVGTPTFSIFSPLISKRGWLPGYPDPEHQAIDITDVVTVGEGQEQAFKDDLQAYYRKITPAMVIERLDRMLENRDKFMRKESTQ